MKLFSEIFNPVKSDKDLEKLISEFPDYDPGYLCQSASDSRKVTKNWMEGLWAQYEPFADPHFLEEFKRQFTQRSWELYLGAVILNHGFRLGKNIGKGADFELQDQDGSRLAWIEAIAVTPGRGADRVPDMEYGSVVNVPVDQISLRIISALKKKHDKYLSDLKKSLLRPEDPYVIAIDRSECGIGDPVIPQILKVLFGIGDLALRVSVGGKRTGEPVSFWMAQSALIKRNGEMIRMSFFEDPKHAGISAVIYTKDHVINSPRSPRDIGENFIVVHNPNAKNPLPIGFFPFGEEYVAEKGEIKKTKEHGNYHSPNPFEDLEKNI